MAKKYENMNDNRSEEPELQRRKRSFNPFEFIYNSDGKGVEKGELAVLEKPGIKNFFKKAFSDMKESTKAQHEVDKANFAATKAESKAQWDEAKMSPAARQAKMQKEREAQIAEANKRKDAAEARIDAAKK